MICSNKSDVPHTGLMFSGGLDSAILLAELLKQGLRVQPFYILTGCRWERAEKLAVDRFVDSVPAERLESVVEFEMPVQDFYGEHWSLGGDRVPDAETPDEAVFLPGRNPLLLLKPALWCAEQGISQLALATLARNPFDDNTPKFFEHFEEMIQAATGKRIEIVLPFANRTKEEVLSLGTNLLLDLTFSCLAPVDGQHCGRCNKCGERQRAFAQRSHADLGKLVGISHR